MKARAQWRDRYPERVTCVRCLEVIDQELLDRMLWCEACRRRARSRAAWQGWLGGIAFGVLVAGYVWLVVRPSDLVVGGWIATVVAAIWLGQKVAREIAYGAMRFKNARAIEAVPPSSPPEEDAVQ
jgi:hypothetical protein